MERFESDVSSNSMMIFPLSKIFPLNLFLLPSFFKNLHSFVKPNPPILTPCKVLIFTGGRVSSVLGALWSALFRAFLLAHVHSRVEEHLSFLSLPLFFLLPSSVSPGCRKGRTHEQIYSSDAGDILVHSPFLILHYVLFSFMWNFPEKCLTQV